MSSRWVRLRGALLKNWGLKLLSLTFATLLWMFVVGEKRSEVSLSVPLELTGVPENLVVVSRVPESVRVRLNGPRTMLAGINAQQLSVALDLRDLEPGSTTFENLPSRMKLPKRIEVTYISPAVVVLEADLKARKVLVVKPRLKGDPATGFRLGESRADPPEIEVEGAARVLRPMREVPTEAVDVSGLDETLERLVEVSFPDSSLRRVSRGPVGLRVEILEEKVNREFRQVPVGVPGRRWVATPPAVNVRVEGGARTISQLSKADVEAIVEGGSRSLPRGPARVVVRVPKGVHVLEVVPRLVELRPEQSLAVPPEGGPENAPEGANGD